MNVTREKIEYWECITLSGPFIVTNTKEVLHIIDEVKEYDSSHLVVDITDVPFMDSSAIGVLLSGSKTLFKCGGELALYGANEVIMDIFRAVQLPNHIAIFRNRNDFIGSKIQ